MNKSIRQKIQQLEGLLGTKDISEWEEGFITNVVAKIKPGNSTTKLTGPTIDKIDQIYQKHFV